MTAPEARSRPESDPLVGVTLNGKFLIHAVIANGGMGRIYRGEQVPLGRPVAIKVLHTKYTASEDDPQFQKRFFLEASILSKLQHPNIVTVFDYGRIENVGDESYFMAMEFLGGETLHRRLRALGALPPVEVIGFVRQIARGLREAHRNGVVHRDLKPSNLMLVPQEDGQELVKILDFGLVKVLADESEELTKEGSFLGSPRYMSPEQIAHGKVDHRTDVYSLGVILYHCLCGRTPFENENSVHTLMAHLQLPVPPMRERNPSVDVPEVLELLARRCMEKDPAHRPSSMEDFLRGLAECESALGLTSNASTTGSSGPSGRFVSGGAVPPVLPMSGAHPPADAQEIFAHTLTSKPMPVAEAVPAAQPQGSRSLTLALAMAIALIGILAAAVIVLMKPGAGNTVAPTPAPAPASPPAPAPPRDYRLVIDCDTPGAQVYEGATLLGATPLTLSVDNQAVQITVRRLEVRAEGFAPFEVPAGPSTEPSVRIIARLTALPPSATPAAGHTPPARPVRPIVRPVRPPVANPHPPDEDIRSHR